MLVLFEIRGSKLPRRLRQYQGCDPFSSYEKMPMPSQDLKPWVSPWHLVNTHKLGIGQYNTWKNPGHTVRAPEFQVSSSLGLQLLLSWQGVQGKRHWSSSETVYSPVHGWGTYRQCGTKTHWSTAYRRHVFPAQKRTKEERMSHLQPEPSETVPKNPES